MAFIDMISDFFAGLRGKGKKKTPPNTEMALEILNLVQEALDNKDDPDQLTAILGRIQQVANHALGESTPLLTGPKNEEEMMKEDVHIDQIGLIQKDKVDFDEHVEIPESVDEKTKDLPDMAESEEHAPSEVKDETKDETQPEDELQAEDESEPEDDTKVVAEPELEAEDEAALEEEPDAGHEPEPKVGEIVQPEPEVAVEEEVQDEAAIEDEPEPMDVDRFIGKRILYAFGNAEEEGLIRSCCETWQIKLDTVTSGLTAVKEFSASEPGTYDAIILEKSMPLMNGFMAAKCIRKDKHAESEIVPIIVSAIGAPVGQTERESEKLSACLMEGTERELYDVLSEIWKEEEAE